MVFAEFEGLGMVPNHADEPSAFAGAMGRHEVLVKVAHDGTINSVDTVLTGD